MDLAALASTWLPAILDASSGVVYIKDVHTRHLFVNRRFEEVFGIERGSAIGKTNEELFPETGELLTAHDRRVVETGAQQEYEETVVTGGITRTFLSRKFALRDAAGVVVGLCGVSTDLTDKRRAEARLQHEQEITARVIESSAYGILAFDNECRYTVWNREMERISGTPADQVLGRVAFDVFPFLVETGEDQYWREALAGRAVASTDRPFVVPAHGREGLYEAHYMPLRDADGGVIGGIAIVRDVTDRRHAEEERLRVARAEAARSEAEAAARRFAFLANASEVLSSSLDHEQTLRHLARLAIPILGDLCIVDVTDEGGLRRIATAHVNAEKADLIEELRRRYPAAPDSPSPAARVIRSGQPELIEHVTRDVVASHTRDDGHADLIRRIGMRSHICVPLVARGSILGALSIGMTESDRRYDGRDLAFARELARRAALAVDNARLYHAAQQELVERRRAEQALRLSESRFRAVMEQSPLSTQMLDVGGKTIRVNRAWEELWGVTIDALADYNMLEDPQLEASGIASVLRRAFAGEAAELPVIRYDPNANETLRDRSKNSDPARWVGAFAYPIKDDEGAVREVVLVHEDITARVRATNELRAAEEATRVLADAGEVLGASLDANVTLRNLAKVVVPRLADWCAVDLVGRDGALERVTVQHGDPSRVALASEMFRRFPPRKGDAHGAGHVIATGLPEWSATLADDVLVAIAHDEEHLALLRSLEMRSYVCVPLIVCDKTVGVLTLAQAESERNYRQADVALATDLARRAAAAVENALLYQRLRDEDRRKDDFLATLAHELRNPLAPLRTGLDMLKTNPDATTISSTRAVMERQLAHMVRLVDDLLDVARITRGRVELQAEPVDAASVIAAALEVSRPALDAAGVAVNVRETDDALVVRGDRTRLAQVLSNLLNNAAKFTPRGGTVDVSAASDGADVTLRVKDTGIGIPPEMLERVFDMFSQVEKAGRSHGGLGIGLTLVRSIVDLHGGRVWAESEGLGRGTTFTVRLPAAVGETPASQRPSDAPNTSARGRRVLIVDDNADAADMMAALLELAGHEVRVANSGPAALDIVGTFRPDAAFLDIGLPGMSGLELAREFRGRAELAKTLLVAVTGWGQAEDRERSRQAGFDHHLTKPVHARDVHALLESLGRARHDAPK